MIRWKLYPIAVLALHAMRSREAVHDYIVALAIALIRTASDYATSGAELHRVAALLTAVPAFIGKVCVGGAIGTVTAIATEVDNVYNVAFAVLDNVRVHISLLLVQFR
jgi:hypothetical protein